MDQSGGLIVTGFEDGVVRLLDVYDPHKMSDVHHERRPIGEAKLRLKQAFKPHNESVTAVAFDQNGKILATGVRDLSLKIILKLHLVLRSLIVSLIYIFKYSASKKLFKFLANFT